MAFKDDLETLKAQLAAEGIPVDELLSAAGLHRTTWMRWNDGTFQPRFENWSGVREAADRLIGKRRAA